MTADVFLGSRSVSRETLDRLDAYRVILGRWNSRINLVAPSTLAEFWSRHALDSAQLLDLAPPMTSRWVDLGSGGGFPGLVVAILAFSERSQLRVTLVESDQRKAAFLNAAAREVGVAVTVLAERAEKTSPLRAEVVSARALAPLDRLLGLAAPHITPGGLALFPKGATWKAEVQAALANWRFNLQNHVSLTDPAGAVLAVEGIARV